MGALELASTQHLDGTCITFFYAAIRAYAVTKPGCVQSEKNMHLCIQLYITCIV